MSDNMSLPDRQKTGLNPSEIKLIMQALTHFPKVACGWLFGSRAKGTWKRGSDIDLAISGDYVDYSVVNSLNYHLNEETVLPYYFDVILLNQDTDPALRQHIEQYAIALK
ncbi:MAG: putative nucleotidyltransferase [Phenylobacterium sp.]|jgi:predicted nucleotidyltransferase